MARILPDFSRSSTRDLRIIIVTKNQLPNVLMRMFDQISEIKHSHENVWQLIFWLEWTTAGHARHLPPVVIPLVALYCDCFCTFIDYIYKKRDWRWFSLPHLFPRLEQADWTLRKLCLGLNFTIELSPLVIKPLSRIKAQVDLIGFLKISLPKMLFTWKQ
jgi:hypothetical protein